MGSYIGQNNATELLILVGLTVTRKGHLFEPVHQHHVHRTRTWSQGIHPRTPENAHS